jgi:hypothetical protein
MENGEWRIVNGEWRIVLILRIGGKCRLIAKVAPSLEIREGGATQSTV